VASIDVPFGHISAVLEGARTARVHLTTVVGGSRRVVHQGGLIDFGGHLLLLRSEVDGRAVEHLQAGPDILHRLSDEEQRETGKVWRWEGSSCPYWENERAETIASVRPSVARPVGFAEERIDHEDLFRYTLRIEPARGDGDPVIARLHEHLRLHGADMVLLDVWLTEDGLLRGAREHFGRSFWRRIRGGMGSTTVDFWDFGVEVDISRPSADEVLHLSA
jgi:hypothetical protein